MYLDKYLKYKNKYLQLQTGGNWMKISLAVDAVNFNAVRKILNSIELKIKDKISLEDLSKYISTYSETVTFNELLRLENNLLFLQNLEPIQLSELVPGEIYFCPCIMSEDREEFKYDNGAISPQKIRINFYLAKSESYDPTDHANKYVFKLKLEDTFLTRPFFIEEVTKNDFISISFDLSGWNDKISTTHDPIIKVVKNIHECIESMRNDFTIPCKIGNLPPSMKATRSLRFVTKLVYEDATSSLRGTDPQFYILQEEIYVPVGIFMRSDENNNFFNDFFDSEETPYNKSVQLFKKINGSYVPYEPSEQHPLQNPINYFILNQGKYKMIGKYHGTLNQPNLWIFKIDNATKCTRYGNNTTIYRKVE